jgi:hypothetical protein
MIYPVAAFGVGGRGRWEGVSGYGGGGGAESENPELCLLEASKTLENGFRPFSYWNTN